MTLDLDAVRRIAAEVGERRGWDFSAMRTDRDPVPWEYEQVVRRYVGAEDRVLDTGTGGGERFLTLAPSFGSGVGTDHDPEMVRVARENTPPGLRGKVRFELMADEALTLPPGSFDAVLNRHSAVFPESVARMLRPGGVFVTQQVGGRNTQSVMDAFGWSSNGARWAADNARRGWPAQDPASLAAAFAGAGCDVVASGEYDVPYFYRDVESLDFHLKAAPFPEDFDPQRHWRPLAQLVAARTAPRGIETNEHRTLLVVRKGVGAGDRPG
jgi:SAM-dependent methyltransferase